MRIRAVVAAIATVCSLIACARPAPPDADPSGVVPQATTTAPASRSPQSAQVGATLDIDTPTGAASYTVGNWRAVPADAQIIPATGVMYSVDVRIVATAGAIPVNGFYFAARTADGTTVAPAVGAVRPGITYGQLTQGQSVDGHVAFDFAPGTAVTGVVLRDPGGKQLAFWSVG